MYYEIFTSLEYKKRCDDSIGNYKKAKLILEKSLGARHASVASTIQFIANVHLERGRLEIYLISKIFMNISQKNVQNSRHFVF